MRILALITVLLLSSGCGGDQDSQRETGASVSSDTHQTADTHQTDQSTHQGETDSLAASQIPDWVPLAVISDVIPEGIVTGVHPDSGRAQTEPAFKALEGALSELRDDHAPLRNGDYHVLTADEERRIFAFSRTLGGETVLVALNSSQEAHSIRIELPAAVRKSYEVIYSTHEEGYRVQQDATALLLEMNEISALVLRGAS